MSFIESWKEGPENREVYIRIWLFGIEYRIKCGGIVSWLTTTSSSKWRNHVLVILVGSSLFITEFRKLLFREQSSLWDFPASKKTWNNWWLYIRTFDDVEWKYDSSVYGVVWCGLQGGIRTKKPTVFFSPPRKNLFYYICRKKGTFFPWKSNLYNGANDGWLDLPQFSRGFAARIMTLLCSEEKYNHKYAGSPYVVGEASVFSFLSFSPQNSTRCCRFMMASRNDHRNDRNYLLTMIFSYCREWLFFSRWFMWHEESFAQIDGRNALLAAASTSVKTFIIAWLLVTRLPYHVSTTCSS